MKHNKAVLLLPVLFLGCSTYSKRECQEMDFYVEGKKAALEGYTLKQGKTHLIDKCGENKGVAVDVIDFERGFSSGLAKLCTPEGRKALDDKDLKYQGTCENHENSLDRKKTAMAELEEKVRQLQTEVTRLKDENAKLQSECPAQ